jgi:hypothetical protein
MSRSRLVVISALAAVLVIAAVLAVGAGREVPAVCGGREVPPPNPNVQLVVLPDKPQYAQGEAMPLRLVLRNTGTRNLELDGPDWMYLMCDARGKEVTPRVHHITDGIQFTLAAGQDIKFPGTRWIPQSFVVLFGHTVLGKLSPGTYIIRVDLISPLSATGLAKVEIVWRT